MLDIGHQSIYLSAGEVKPIDQGFDLFVADRMCSLKSNKNLI